jgi:hypothetical protein
MDGGTDSATDAGDGGGIAQTCAAYCAAIAATCTGPTAQYIADSDGGMSECMTACGLFPAGMASDTSGDTLGCRIYHTQLAMTTKDPHCWHAGPFGFGACGGTCANFCALATTYCSPSGGFDGGAPPYGDAGDCTTSCMGYTGIDGTGDAGTIFIDGGFNSAAPTSGNTRDCREWHLSKALTSPANQQVHCNHVGAVSSTCN